jgi:hypothetical protein
MKPISQPHPANKTAYADAILARDDLSPEARKQIERVRDNWRADGLWLVLQHSTTVIIGRWERPAGRTGALRNGCALAALAFTKTSGSLLTRDAMGKPDVYRPSEGLHAGAAARDMT